MDDAFGLYLSNVGVIDGIVEEGDDPGSGWTVTDDYNTKDI